MKKRIIAGLLALALVAVPVTSVFGQTTVSVPVAGAQASLASIGEFAEVHDGQLAIPLRALAEAFQINVDWNSRNHIVTLSANAGNVIDHFSSDLGGVAPALRALVQGGFHVQLQQVENGLQVVGPSSAAGMVISAFTVNDRFWLPIVNLAGLTVPQVIEVFNSPAVSQNLLIQVLSSITNFNIVELVPAGNNVNVVLR